MIDQSQSQQSIAGLPAFGFLTRRFDLLVREGSTERKSFSSMAHFDDQGFAINGN